MCKHSASLGIRFKSERFLLLTISNQECDAHRRLIKSAEVNGLPHKTLGMGQKWEGLGQKIRLLKQELEHHKSDKSKIILFADAFDVLVNAKAEQIAAKFTSFDADIVFSAEENCWPDESLCSRYPEIKRGKRFLNSGLIIGYAPTMYRLMSVSQFPLAGNDQLYFSQIFVNNQLREEMRLKLDHLCHLFQTMEGGTNNVQLRFQGAQVVFHNNDYKTKPLVIHTPGYCKMLTSLIAIYLPQMWSFLPDRCALCSEDEKKALVKLSTGEFPDILVTVAIKRAENVLPFLEQLLKLDYPRDKIHLILHNELKQMEETLEAFAGSHAQQYAAFRTIYHYETNTTGVSSNDLQMKDCIMGRCTHYLKIDAATRLDDPQMLRMLIEQNPVALAPMLYGHDKEAPKFFEFSYANGRCLNSIEVVGSNHVIKVGMF